MLSKNANNVVLIVSAYVIFYFKEQRVILALKHNNPDSQLIATYFR